MSKALSIGRALGIKVSLSALCKHQGLCRDGYYKHEQRVKTCAQQQILILQAIKSRRKELSREGGKKLYRAIRDDLATQGIHIGRDKLYDILRSEGLLVKRKRSYHKTTNSYHRFRVYKNLIKDLTITHPNQVWVSDITYIRLNKGHCYLALITDLYSRKIVGYDISGSLELAGCRRAYKTARRHARPALGLVHHSDRGFQYCSNEYVSLLQSDGAQISMTEENHCYENAVAERVNGILKDEFYLDQTFASLELAKKACEKAIRLYNSKRLHLSLGYKTPDQVFKMRA